MKSTIIFIVALMVFAGCANSPKAMKADKKYFRPVATYTQLKKKPVSKTKFTSTMLKKELDEKNTMIELLSKENQQLRERVARLEKRLSIIQS